MSYLAGVTPIGDYATGSPTNKDAIQKLIDIIPDPGAAHGSGAVAGGSQGIKNTYLDEMSPGAAAQLRAELIALKAAVENV
jgi:hypothetical protein